jgi:hypothetical protein
VVAEGFLRSPELAQVAYWRGDLLAWILGDEIRRRSAGARTPDDLLRELVARGRAGSWVTTESLLDVFTRETSAAFGAQLGAVVIAGGPLPAPPDERQ